MIVLPEDLEKLLKADVTGHYKGIIDSARSKFGQIFSENRLYFFEEYTDHGTRHINSVLKACANLIKSDTYKLLNKRDVSILVMSVLLHDIGMHLQPLVFRRMIEGGYDDVLTEFDEYGDKKWSVLWESYLWEAKKFNDQQKKNIFGDSDLYITEPNYSNPDSLTGIHKKLIGEFIRRHHPRIAFEIAFKGLTKSDGTQMDFFVDVDFDDKLLAGFLARSHGMNIRDTFPFLEKRFGRRGWRRPHGVHIVYLMTVLRLADYFQIDESRVLKVPYFTRQFQSPVSFTEHQKHLQIKCVRTSDDDLETLYVIAEPANSTLFLALEKLLKNIQQEMDHSWAILGEIYGLRPDLEQPKLSYRRICSNLDDKRFFGETVNYVPETISFTVDKELPKLLVEPLYDYDPSFGVRELLQNSVDACWEREFHEQKNEKSYNGEILIKIEPLNDRFLFSIIDNGKGMTLDEIKNYFLNIGGSIRKGEKWLHDHVDEKGHSNISKSGRFGIGVLAAYLLGAKIEVKTKSIFSSIGYSFRTTLDQEQIEIIKTKDLSYGTSITINISKDKFDNLKNNKHVIGKEIENTMRFDNWYVLNYPSVIYEIPDIDVDEDSVEKRFPELYKEDVKDHFPNCYETDINWSEILDPNYRKIVWSYTKRAREAIICNGFIIPNSYALEGYQLTPPTILVFDNDAKLPLNLNRTTVEEPLSFIDLLAESIYKDIIAAVLVTDVENIFASHSGEQNQLELTHPAFSNSIHGREDDYALNYPLSLIFSRSGFFLNDPSVFRQISGLNYLTVFKHETKRKLSDQLRLKHLFEHSHVDIVRFSFLGVPTRIVEDYLIDIGNGLFQYDDKILLGSTNDFFLQQNKDLGIDIQKEFMKSRAKGVSLLYYKLTKPYYRGGSLGDMLLELLGDDLLIPYNMDERKKKFPKAFMELEGYMKKYLNKNISGSV